VGEFKRGDKMNNEEGNFENVNGSGHIITESEEKLPLTAGRPIKVLHPLLGWVQGIYQYDYTSMIPKWLF
jgi:hypothetical protein